MAKPDEQSNLPPIPDGGLSASMPEWLRRPPAWRTLEDSEVVQSEPAATATLPEPDTSMIDPRTFLTDDDLPGWLRGLGRGRPPAAPAGDDEVDQGSAEAEPPPVVAERIAAEPGRFVPIQPGSSGVESRATVDARSPSRTVSQQPPSREVHWWQGGQLVAMLGLLLVVAIAVIVVLAVL